MIFSQLALSFVLTAGSTMAAQFATPPSSNRKLSKNHAAGGGNNSSSGMLPPPSSVTGMDGIEGVYLYTNKCNNVFQAIIECGLFGDDPDLCLYSEYTIADIVADCDDDEVSAGTCEAVDDGVFFKKNDKLPVDGSSIDPNNVCIFSGTFRASSAMDGRNMLHPIPLASSNGCPTTTANFQLVVQGMVMDDGDLELEFSDNFGQSYYTKEKVCPNSYIGRKVSDDIVDQTRALARVDDGDGTMNKYHRHLCPMTGLALIAGFFIYIFPLVESGVLCAFTSNCRAPDYSLFMEIAAKPAN
jgi:hypothetical protein